MSRVVVSWSGGKESCLACYKAMLDGFEVSRLLNLMSKDGRCMSHGIDSKLIVVQSQATGIQMVQKETTWETYEQSFKDTVRELKQTGIKGVVFGNLRTIPGHVGWINRVCNELDVKAITPLWGFDPEQVLMEFIDEGFEAVVVSTKADVLGKEWLGRKINRDFVRDLLRDKTEVDPCGELGEYHTFALDGPLFKRRINILEGSKVLKNEYWFLDISKYEIVGERSCKTK